ncbi:MAG: hypothetical protein CL581_18690 [Alteromonadaceae bacterium]|nr:hypothetical protein [Alteromonadaceae bacterium]
MTVEADRETFLAVTNNGVDHEDLLECLAQETDKLWEFCIEADYKYSWPQQLVFARLGEFVFEKLRDELEAALTNPPLEPLVQSYEAAQAALSAHESAQEDACRELAPGTLSEVIEEITGQVTR